MGEKPGRREAMDRMVKKMIKNGANRDYAKKKAVECAQRADKKEKK